MILAHSQFEKIPISTERQIAMLERQINDIENAIYEIKSENGENWSVKQMVIFRKNLDERLKKLSAEEKKDDLLTFEQLGVDMMMVDEAHFSKTALSLQSCEMWLVLQPQAVNAPLICCSNVSICRKQIRGAA